MFIKNVPCLLFILLCLTTNVYASTTLKLAFLAPEGVTWSNGIEKIADAVKIKTQGRVEFKLYFNGVVGDEADVLRKIRVGQMSGGMFT
jgi:TRAP-type C4-dicarboxylate transport system substrate-binding protein